ncbi:MAG: hypothetical protein RL318_1657 [Fibrobacterota bacterium]|jgi:UDP-N-acetylglucosamine/UDP-N-acetylgalactosamine diphosphorylase
MDLIPLLEQHGQSPLASALMRLDGSARNHLESQAASVDWAEVTHAHASAGPAAPAPEIPALLPPISSTPSAQDAWSFRAHGIEMLAAGKAAFVLMAGGQGSRLGFSGPKGIAPLGFPDDWTLFDLLCRRLSRLGKISGRTPLFLVMTSPENDASTRAWFSARESLFPPSGLRFFQQGVFPALDTNGHALLASPESLALAPDGNGGVFLALERSGLLSELEASGVEWLHIAGVDNALSVPCDPVFLGFADLSGSPVSSKTVLREEPTEKAGVFRLDTEGKPGVAEYTEIGALADKRAPDGGLLFREANIASHFVRTATAARFAREGLPWHLARKKLATLDAATGLENPDPVCKYERFLFDAFPLAGSMSLLRVDRSMEFAPVKNADGVDSPASALAALRAQTAAWRKSWIAQGLSTDSPLLQGELVNPGLSLWGELPG